MIRNEQDTSRGRKRSTNLPNIDLAQVADYNVYDRGGEHMGKVSCIWTDQRGQPAYLGVKTHWLLGKTHVVPAHGAEVNQQAERVRLPYQEDDVKNAPCYDPEAELDFTKEQEVLAYYRAKGPALPELQQSGTSQSSEQTSEDMTETTEVRRARSSPEARTQEEARISLHEEQLKVGTRQVEMGGVRLRKIVRTETVNQPVELRREEIVVERVPATEAQSGQTAFEGEELYIPLRSEEAVVEKEVRVREEVRARKTARTEKQNVSGEVRREDVEVEQGQQSAPGAAQRGQARSPQATSGREGTQSVPSGERKAGGKKAVFGLVQDEGQASRIIDHLKEHGFSNDDISVLLPDKGSTREFAHEKNTKAPEGAATGAGTGGLLGGALGWLAGAGALAIPGVGPFIAAGPLMAALGGAAVGATAGGLVGTLVGMGIPEYEAKRYEGRLKEGRILISIHSDNADETRRAKEVLERDGAEDISSAGEESVSSSSARKTAGRNR